MQEKRNSTYELPSHILGIVTTIIKMSSYAHDQLAMYSTNQEIKRKNKKEATDVRCPYSAAFKPLISANQWLWFHIQQVGCRIQGAP